MCGTLKIDDGDAPLSLAAVQVDVYGRTPSPVPFPDSHVQCSASWEQKHWPSFHLLNNVTRLPNGALEMEDLNDGECKNTQSIFFASSACVCFRLEPIA